MSDTGVTETTDDLDDYPDDVKPAPAVREAPKQKFGWCLTGHHRECKRVSNDGKRVCPDTCEDHGVDYVPMPAFMDDNLAAVIAKYNL